MKKIISMLGAIVLVGTGTGTLVSCSQTNTNHAPVKPTKFDIQLSESSLVLDTVVNKQKDVIISNFADLKGVHLTVKNQTIISAEQIAGKISIKALKPGKSELVISADNATNNATIKITVQPEQTTIQLDTQKIKIDTANFTPDKPSMGVVKIMNYKYLDPNKIRVASGDNTTINPDIVVKPDGDIGIVTLVAHKKLTGEFERDTQVTFTYGDASKWTTTIVNVAVINSKIKM